MRTRGLAAAVVALVTGCAAASAPSTRATEARSALLAALDGNWVMVGDVMGKPVRYRLIVSPVLAGTFTELHMTDTQEPPQYEARVFIAHDQESGQVIAHWMDTSGGKGSVPHGTGKLADNTIEFTIPYADSPFRDRLTRDADSGKWRFTVESSDGSGAWKHFAAYEIQRAD